jgi:hypothetical protein
LKSHIQQKFTNFGGSSIDEKTSATSKQNPINFNIAKTPPKTAKEKHKMILHHEQESASV